MADPAIACRKLARRRKRSLARSVLHVGSRMASSPALRRLPARCDVYVFGTFDRSADAHRRAAARVARRLAVSEAQVLTILAMDQRVRIKSRLAPELTAKLMQVLHDAGVRAIYVEADGPPPPTAAFDALEPHTRVPGDVTTLDVRQALRSELEATPQRTTLAAAPAPAPPARRAVDPDALYRQGQQHLRQGNYATAEEYLERAVQARPDLELRVAHAWARYNNPRHPRDEASMEALVVLSAAARERPDHADVHYYCGAIFLAQDRIEAARHAFRLAVHCDPDHHEARRGLRLVEARLHKKT